MVARLSMPVVKQWAATRPTSGVGRMLVRGTVSENKMQAWHRLSRIVLKRGGIEEATLNEFGPAMVEELEALGFTVERVKVGPV